jgi:hypothetical protein
MRQRAHTCTHRTLHHSCLGPTARPPNVRAFSFPGTNMAHTRQSRLDSSRGFLVKVVDSRTVPHAGMNMAHVRQAKLDSGLSIGQSRLYYGLKTVKARFRDEYGTHKDVSTCAHLFPHAQAFSLPSFHKVDLQQSICVGIYLTF